MIINTLLFDWGDTIMVDFKEEVGPMYRWKKIEPVKNAKKTLEFLSKKYLCYLATNAADSSKDEIIKSLKMVKLNQYFKDIFCYKTIGFKKSSKEYFNFIKKYLSTEYENMVMISDNLENDILIIEKFGINTIWFNPKKLYSDYRGIIIEDLLELKVVLEQMPNNSM